LNKIKQLFCLVSALFIFDVVSAQNSAIKNQIFYIVRHAEKYTGTNPAISIKGMKRAGDLYRVLKNKKIDLIMISQYRRTGMTGDSLRIYKNIDTVYYTADTTGESIFKKINPFAGKAKNILIIGHSNTLPAIIRKAGVKDFMLKEIPDYEYDNLFIVKRQKGRAVLKSKKYGEVSLPPQKNATMNISQ
jgi:2,3-bisphosphoglycerate-dependent phosphoglycerate mutase